MHIYTVVISQTYSYPGVINTLERISPQVIVLNPPGKLVIETWASGGYQWSAWRKNLNPFSVHPSNPFFVRVPDEFPNFYEIFVREPTTIDDLGVYEVELVLSPGQIQADRIGFVVTPYSTYINCLSGQLLLCMYESMQYYTDHAPLLLSHTGVPTTINLNGTVTLQEGDSVSIICVSAGNPIPTITWYLRGSLAPFSQNDTVNPFQGEITDTQFMFIEGNVTSELKIMNATYPAHAGEYTCVGLNSYRGENSSHATITVEVEGK